MLNFIHEGYLISEGDVLKFKESQRTDGVIPDMGDRIFLREYFGEGLFGIVLPHYVYKDTIRAVYTSRQIPAVYLNPLKKPTKFVDSTYGGIEYKDRLSSYYVYLAQIDLDRSLLFHNK